MPAVNVVLTAHYPTHGTNSRGNWTRHDFKDSAGQKYQTFDAALGNKAFGLLNKPAVVTYEDVARGEFTNRVLKAVEPDGAVSVAPVASQAPPTLVVANPQFSGGSGDERQVQIMRQSALERAIRVWAAGIQDSSRTPTLYELSEEFLSYFQTGEYPGKHAAPSAQEQAVVDEFAAEFGTAA